MDAGEIETQLAEVAAKRIDAEEAADALNDDERNLIVAAWRAGIAPTQIARIARRTDSHVRKLRPEDVPPARLGGGAARKRRRKPTA